MAIKTYEKTDRARLSANFTAGELACKGVSCGCQTVLADDKLVEYLQRIRDHFGKPVTVTSGYRCSTHNKNVGGAAASRHTKGQAADITVKDTAPDEVARYAESIGVKGIGLYETAKDGFFVHIDTRENKYFWYGQAQAYRDTFGGSGFSMDFRPLRRNCRGEDVRAIQILLSGNGFACGFADGVFGAKTEDAVRRYQQKKGFPVTGEVEENTAGALLGRGEREEE